LKHRRKRRPNRRASELLHRYHRQRVGSRPL